LSIEETLFFINISPCHFLDYIVILFFNLSYWFKFCTFCFSLFVENVFYLPLEKIWKFSVYLQFT